jgi:hypothetical protein
MLPAADGFRQKWVLVPGARRFSTLKMPHYAWLLSLAKFELGKLP